MTAKELFLDEIKFVRVTAGGCFLSLNKQVCKVDSFSFDLERFHEEPSSARFTIITANEAKGLVGELLQYENIGIESWTWYGDDKMQVSFKTEIDGYDISGDGLTLFYLKTSGEKTEPATPLVYNVATRQWEANPLS